MTTRTRPNVRNITCFIAGVALTVGLASWGMAVADESTTLPPCATEDSDNCYWDADTMGNGQGRSFTVTDGVVTYDDGLPAPAVPGSPAPADPATEATSDDVAPHVVNENPGAVVNEDACIPGDAEIACGPVNEYDEGVLICGTGAAPAIDQDRHGNWWAYCEPAMVNEDGTLWQGEGDE